MVAWSARLIAVFDERLEPGREPPGIDEVDEMAVAGPLLDLGIRQAAEPLALAVRGRPSEHRQAGDLDPGRRFIDPFLGAAATLAFVATQTGDASASARLRQALLPYQGRLAIFSGAVMCMGPVSFFLGLLATQLGLPEEAVSCLDEATAFAEKTGALPILVLCLQAAAGALDLRQAPGDLQKASACRARASGSPSS